MIERLIGIGRCNRMEMNVEKYNVMRNSRQPSPMQIMVDKKQQGNLEYFSYVGSMITYDARCTWEIKSKTVMKKAAFDKKKNLFTGKLDINLRKKLVNCYIWSIALYGAENWTLRKIDRNVVQTIKRRKANWIGQISRRNWRYWRKEGGIEVTGRRRKQLLTDIRERENTVNWKRKHLIALCEELDLEEAIVLL